MNKLMYKLGKSITDWIESVSAPLQLLPLTVISLFNDVKDNKQTFRNIMLRELYKAGVKALPLTILSGLIFGFLLIRMFPYNYISFGIENIYGTIFSVFIFRELAPLITLLIILIRSGVFVTIQIAKMKEQDELKILEIMGINPIQYLGSIKLFSGIIIAPTLTTYFGFASVISSMLTAFIFYKVPPISFFQEVAVTTTLMDIIIVLLKSIFAGFIIFIIAINFGLATFKKKRNLSSRVTRTIIFSITGYAIFELIISMGIYGFN